MEKLLSIGEAAEMYGMHIDTFRNWERRGYLFPLRTPGGHRRYKKEHLDQLIAVKTKPIPYLLQFNTYRTLPATLQMFGGVEVGDSLRFEPNPVSGYELAEMGTFSKMYDVSVEMPAIEKRLYFEDTKPSNVTIASALKYTNFYFAKEESVLQLNLFDVVDMHRIDAREISVPEEAWGVEGSWKDGENSFCIKYVYYKRID